MQLPGPAQLARLASGLAGTDSLLDPERVEIVQRVADAAAGSELLGGLVRLAAAQTGTPGAQLSLIAREQLACSIWNETDLEGVGQPLGLEQSICSLALLSGDVLVAGDAAAHPWLGDLLPVACGAIGAYLGVPLLLPDGTLLGALCVWDVQPRTWSPRDVELTCAVADLVALELHRLRVLTSS